jgi:uroporphyrinogen-III decarboxylase
LLFDRTDIVKAKKVVGDRLCMNGNVPTDMLLTGASEEVKNYC